MIRPIGIQTVLILLITMALPINAEPIEVVDDWVQEALTNNATLGAQRSVAEMSEAKVEGSDTWADPVIKYGIAPETLEGPNTVGHRFEVSQQLPWPDHLSASRKAAEAGMLAAQQETQWLIRQLTARVKEAYAYWWYTNEAINLHHETRALVEQLATVTEQRLDYGIGSQSEMLRVKTELDTLARISHRSPASLADCAGYRHYRSLAAVTDQ
ncbi:MULTISPECIES: TolC family protein [Marinobacter]|jgi:outer membrane protein TolC|uniref:Outer membrane efflux protein n=4 Tax=Marinobacter TaxID=2742 RepID=G6YX55_9GAMM|nr:MULTISPECIES: TolC family protein [Marinobacter]EHJ03222.1 outer membrane efflux protein [Marinobacter manganoxydans MnI7-9]|tara:strand:+ start:13699 stop:14337 length:639 start_codon:yes stop_codon:yes gene_type:complete